jgi:transposase
LHATAQESEAVQQKRAACLEAIRPIDPQELIVVDESGSNRAMAREYARGPQGQRAHSAKPLNRGPHGTMIGALGLLGVVAAMRVEGFTDGAVFVAFGHEVLGPQLRPGQGVVRDTLKAHQVAGVREAIDAVGARLLSWPPYSPEFAPLEECWSKRKAILRTKAARTVEHREQAIAEAFDAVTSLEARGWFAHASYCAESN